MTQTVVRMVHPYGTEKYMRSAVCPHISCFVTRFKQKTTHPSVLHVSGLDRGGLSEVDESRPVQEERLHGGRCQETIAEGSFTACGRSRRGRAVVVDHNDVVRRSRRRRVVGQNSCRVYRQSLEFSVDLKIRASMHTRGEILSGKKWCGWVQACLPALSFSDRCDEA